MASTIRGDDNFDSAGPFGSLELISETSITSDVNYIDISFPTGYEGFYIDLLGLVCPSARNPGSLESRLKDSSNNLLTGPEYYYRHSSATDSSSSWRYMGELGSSTGGVKANYRIFVLDPRNSSLNTSASCTGWGGYGSGGTSSLQPNSVMTYGVPLQTNGIRFFHQNSSDGANTSFTSSSNSYRLWGIT